MSQQILIVDDDPAMRRLLEHYLSDEGYAVLTATDGEDALRMLRRNAASIVITDWTMPHMNGLELTTALRSCEGHGFLYIIVLTGSHEGGAIEAFEAGADDYVTKPIQKRELVARIKAGERIVVLQEELQAKTREVFRSNAQIEIAQRRLVEANKRLNEMATTDSLTALSNRRAARDMFANIWSVACRHGQPLSCIMMDIDHFKSVNDEFGHAAGDLVLIEIASTLQGTVRDSDVLCRYGGEEFLVICPQTTAEQAKIGAERLREAVEKMTVLCGKEPLTITISLGVADCSIGMSTMDDLINAADLALYASKRNGRNQVTLASAELLDEAA